MRLSPRTLALSLALVGVAAAGAVATCGPEPETPATLAPKVEAHRVASAIDSVRLLAVREEARRAARAETAAVVRARAAERSAVAHRRLADSLAAEARAAVTLADSARGWQEAYLARTVEADSLRVVVAEERTARAHADTQVALYMRADSTHERRHARADSLLRAAVAVANEAGKCRILGLVRCPTRKAAVIGGVVVGVFVGSGAAARLVRAAGSM